MQPCISLTLPYDYSTARVNRVAGDASWMITQWDCPGPGRHVDLPTGGA